jgi:hypothetical protein
MRTHLRSNVICHYFGGFNARHLCLISYNLCIHNNVTHVPINTLLDSLVKGIVQRV